MIEWLLEVMERQEITRDEMAEMIGMTHEEFADCADGKEVFTVPDMERMCEFLGVGWHLFHHPERAVDIADWRRRHGKDKSVRRGRSGSSAADPRRQSQEKERTT